MATPTEVLEKIVVCEATITASIAILDTAARTLQAASLLSCSVGGTIGALLSPDIKSLARKIEQTIGRSLEAITNLICAVKAILVRLQKFFRALRKAITQLLRGALQIIAAILDSIVAVFNFITDLITSIVNDLLAAIRALAQQLISWIKGLLTINCGVSLNALLSGDPCSAAARDVQNALDDALNTKRNDQNFRENLSRTYGGSALAQLTSIDQLSTYIKRKIDEAILNMKNSIKSAIDNMERACGELLAA